MFTAAQVKAILDTAFAKLESKSPGWAQIGEKLANTTIDASPVPQFVADELNALVGKG